MDKNMGQRIAQKRKELGLSQEALGEELGVSRQAIYKWESGNALPEIEKLIALSRRFGVSVGWLLGVEEDAAPAAPCDGELSEQQLKMVEEIVQRYLAAQQRPKRCWVVVLLCLVGIAAAANLFSRLERLNTRYNDLQISINQVSGSVNSQVNGISERVEELLQAQNDLTADYGVTLMAVDARQETGEFSLYAVPKTYLPGMRTEFVADSGGESVTVVGTEGEQQRFSATLVCPLSDEILLSAVFVHPDGTRETQRLEWYGGLLSETYPSIEDVSTYLFGTDLTDGVLRLENEYAIISAAPAVRGDAQIVSMRLGMFLNRRLLAWAEPCEQPESYHGDYGGEFYRLPELELPMEVGDELVFAAKITDSAGRTFMAASVGYVVEEGSGDSSPFLMFGEGDFTAADRDLSAWQWDE